MPIHDWTRVSAGIFHDFQLEWISALKRVLNRGVLPKDYYALAEQVTGGLHPDVLTLEHKPKDGLAPADPRGPGHGNGQGNSTPGGGITLAVAPPRVRFTARAEPDPYAKKRSRIAIRHSSDDQVVAILEIVSPGNKASRHELRFFIEKTVEFLAAGIHLQILDLFPPGPRDPQGIHAAIWSEIKDDAFQLPPGKPLTLAAYSAGLVQTAFIEPVAVGDSLPEMPLFLEPEVYVLVPLEKAYCLAFDAVPPRWQEVLQEPNPGTAP